MQFNLMLKKAFTDVMHTYFFLKLQFLSSEKTHKTAAAAKDSRSNYQLNFILFKCQDCPEQEKNMSAGVLNFLRKFSKFSSESLLVFIN